LPGSSALNAILCGTPSIRDGIAFPKTAKGTCLMTDSPAPVAARQLKELHIEVKAANRGCPSGLPHGTSSLLTLQERFRIVSANVHSLAGMGFFIECN